jgi:hypothetical protein
MKTWIKVGTAALALAVMGVASEAASNRAAKDPTKYDCYQYVRVPSISPAYDVKFGPKIVKVCPYKDKLAAGKCETDIWGRMRCIE